MYCNNQCNQKVVTELYYCVTVLDRTALSRHLREKFYLKFLGRGNAPPRSTSRFQEVLHSSRVRFRVLFQHAGLRSGLTLKQPVMLAVGLMARCITLTITLHDGILSVRLLLLLLLLLSEHLYSELSLKSSNVLNVCTMLQSITEHEVVCAQLR